MTTNDDLQDTVAWEDIPILNEPVTFGSMLWSFRECDELTQAEVALQLGISRQLLNAYEKGRKLPSIELAYRMAQTLGMSPELSVLLVVNEQIARQDIPIRLSLAS